MKKLLIPFLVTILFSCSDDDGTNTGGVRTTECRISKSVQTYGFDTLSSSITNFVYSGDFLNKITRGGQFNLYDSVFFVYDENNRQSLNLKLNSFTGRLDTSATFKYDNAGNLILIKQFYNDFDTEEYRFLYVNNRLKEISYSDRDTTQRIAVRTDSKGNLTEYWSVNSLGAKVPGLTAVFEYDDRINPYQNFFFDELGVVGMFNSNNIVSSEYYENEVLYYSSKVNYTYNKLDFPITSLETDSDGDVINYTYSYECF